LSTKKSTANSSAKFKARTKTFELSFTNSFTKATKKMVVILELPLPKSRSILFENVFDQTGDPSALPLSAISAYRNDLVSVLAQPEPLPVLRAIDTYLPFFLAMKDSVQQLLGKNTPISIYLIYIIHKVIYSNIFFSFLLDKSHRSKFPEQFLLV
jgi:hypothetical protein